MFIDQMHHELFSFDYSLHYTDLPLVIVIYIDPVTDLKSLPPVTLSQHSRGTQVHSVSGPIVTETHFYHKYVTIFHYEVLQRAIQFLNYRNGL